MYTGRMIRSSLLRMAPTLGMCLAIFLMPSCGENPPRDGSADAGSVVKPPARAATPLVASPTAVAPAPVSVPIPEPKAANRVEAYRWKPGASAPDGRLGSTGTGWNTLLMVPGVLQGGHEYLAQLSYKVVISPPYPGQFFGCFHMFARSKSLGQERDVWVNWLGDVGERGTVRLPLVLAAADDWVFNVGCKGAGELIVESLVIYEGTGFAFIPATGDATEPAAASSAPVATGYRPIIIDPPAAGQGLEVSVSEFGMVADGASGPVTPEVAEANALGLNRALRACGTRNASRLVFPTGTYRIAPKDALMIEDLHDLTIDGQGSELIYTKLLRNVSAWNLSNCKRVVIRNLCIDWDWALNPIASLMQVQSVSEDRRSFTLAFPDLDAAGVERLKTVEWTHISPMDPQTFLLTNPQRITQKVVSRETVAGNVLKATFATPLPLNVGEHYLIRHLYYEMGAFKMNGISHVQFDHVKIYSMPGMGWVGRGDLDHLALTNCQIQRRPGSRRPLSTSADGFHILDSQGGIIIEDCEFTGTGDDCINIHDNCAQGVNKTGPSTLVLINNPRWRMKAVTGDRVELYRPDYAPIGFVGTVKTVTYAGNDAVLEFAEPLPEVVSPLSIAFNHRYGTTDVHIARCHFSHGRVMFSAKHATIEDCTFDQPFANAIQLATEIAGNLWSEGSGNEDIVIRNNVIRGANICGKFGGAVIHAAPVLPAGRTEYPLFRRILIENNRIIDSRGPMLNLGACQDVVVRGNRIEADAPVPGANALAGCIKVECSSDLRLGGNTWKAGAGQNKPGIVVDGATTHQLLTTANRLE